MDDPVEIELKLEADPAGLAALIDSGLLPSPGKRKRLHSIYYDTPRHEVLAHGFTLRVRKEGRDYIQTVKAEAGGAAGLFARNEWEWPAGDFSPDLGKTDLPFTGRIDPRTIRRVRPLFETDMDRIACVTDHDGAKIELAIDTGNVCAGDQASPLCEIELELLDGPAAPLFEFARAIDQQIPVRIGVLSKAERGYALARPKSQPVKAHRAPEVRLKAGDDAATCFRKIASSCIRHYRMNETLLLDTGAAEPLHQARVALRRLRSAFSLFKPLLATDPRSEMLRAEIKWLASELGRIRNLDVLIKRTRGKTRKQLMVVRAEAFAHLLPTINSARTRLLMIDLVEWLELGEWHRPINAIDSLHMPGMKFARDALRRQRKRLKKRGHDFAKLDDAQLHPVRIEAKKLRYATEFFATLFAESKTAEQRMDFRDRLESLQDILGDLNDMATAPALYERFAITPPRLAKGEPRRKQLREDAAQAFAELIDADRFWK